MQLQKKGIIIIPVLLILVIASSSCRPRKFNNGQDHFKKFVYSEKIVDAVTERIKSGATIKDFLPPTGVMVAAMMVPITGSIGFFLVLFVFIRLHHKRAMLMIKNGTYKPGTMTKTIRWDLIVALIGTICLFVGPGISIVTVSMFGVYMWSITSGLIPILSGSALLLFYYKFLK